RYAVPRLLHRDPLQLREPRQWRSGGEAANVAGANARLDVRARAAGAGCVGAADIGMVQLADLLGKAHPSQQIVDAHRMITLARRRGSAQARDAAGRRAGCAPDAARADGTPRG